MSVLFFCMMWWYGIVSVIGFDVYVDVIVCIVCGELSVFVIFE